jgi:hypothetical protein
LIMSVAGPLIAVGFAFLFAGLYRAATAPRIFADHDGWGLVALGAAVAGAGFELWSHGVS